MLKIHTRLKRKNRLPTHLNPYYAFFHLSSKPHRPKTFKNEEAAQAWASQQGLKPGQYHLKPVKRQKRLQIVKISKEQNISSKA